jgi:hypothetical protein
MISSVASGEVISIPVLLFYHPGHHFLESFDVLSVSILGVLKSLKRRLDLIQACDPVRDAIPYFRIPRGIAEERIQCGYAMTFEIGSESIHFDARRV